jgi:photosystem II stability/assembly factor-like uncharacterized protein
MLLTAAGLAAIVLVRRRQCRRELRPIGGNGPFLEGPDKIIRTSVSGDDRSDPRWRNLSALRPPASHAFLVTLAALCAAALPVSAQFTGWAVGLGGAIVHTTNGGANWSAQSSGTGSILKAVAFVDPNNGWAVGFSGVILRTSDGGVTWSSQTSGTSDELRGVSFVDVNNGWVVGGLQTIRGTILHTSDGGSTWSAQSSGTTKRLNAVSFVDGKNGWAVGDFGTILHTTDGGATWASQISGTGDLFSVSFVDANNGWGVGNPINNILHTSDSGTTWSAQNSGTGDALLGVSFVDANNGWVVGGHAGSGNILQTSNGGLSWSSQSGGTNELFGVSFVDINNGWVVGVGGAILHTSNGGIAWSAQSSGTGDALFGVSFVKCPALTILALSATPNVLWPPDHKMVPVILSATASGGCGSASCQITSVSSNEPVDLDGDWVITGPLTLNLRSERNGLGTGRIYTITVECTDASGERTNQTITVMVPHDQGQ